MAFTEEKYLKSFDIEDWQNEDLSVIPPNRGELSKPDKAAIDYLKSIGEYAGTEAQRWSREKIELNTKTAERSKEKVWTPLLGTLVEAGRTFRPIASGFAYGIGEHINKYMGDVADNIQSGRMVKEIARLFLGNIGKKGTTDKLLDLIPTRKSKAPSGLAQEFYRGGEFWMKLAKQPQGIAEKLYFALGTLPPILAKYAIASKLFGGPIAGFALERYAQTLDPMEAMRAAALGYVLNGTAAMPYIVKAPAVASYAMVDAAVSGAEPEDVLVSGAVMAILASTGKSPTWKEWRAQGKEAAYIADIEGLDAEPRQECINDLIDVLLKRQIEIEKNPELADRILKTHQKMDLENDKRLRPWKYREPSIQKEPIRPGVEVPVEPTEKPQPSGEKPKRGPVTAKEFLDRVKKSLEPEPKPTVKAPERLKTRLVKEVTKEDLQIEPIKRVEPKFIPEVPEFKSTNEAQAFGKTASPDQIERMKDFKQDAAMLRDAAIKAGMGERALEHGMDVQFYNEAIAASEGKVASVKMIITNADKVRLRELGYTDKGIARLKPQEAADIINKFKKPKPVTEYKTEMMQKEGEVSPEQRAEIDKLRSFKRKLSKGQKLTLTEEAELTKFGKQVRTAFFLRKLDEITKKKTGEGFVESDYAIETIAATKKKPYEDLVPGTQEWKSAWKENPKLQDEMVEYAKQYDDVVKSQSVKNKVEDIITEKPVSESLLSPEEEAKLQEEIRIAKARTRIDVDAKAKKAVEEHDSKLLEEELAEMAEDQAYDRMGISRYKRENIDDEVRDLTEEVYDDVEYVNEKALEELRGKKSEEFDNITTDDGDIVLSFLGLFGRSNKILNDTYEAYRKFERWIGRTKIGKYLVEHPGLTPEEVALMDKLKAAETTHVLAPAKLLQDVMTIKQQGGFLRRAKRFTKDERIIIGKLLRSNLTDNEIESDLKIKEVAKFVRDELDFTSELLIDILERQPKPPTKLIETIRKNQGTYMKREFMRNIDPDFKPTEEVMERAIKMFQDNFARGRGANKRMITREEAEKMVDHLLTKGKPSTFKREGISGPRIKKRFLTRRKEMNDVMDELLGLVKDPTYPVIKGIMEVSRFVEHSLWFENISKNPNIVSDVRKPEFSLMEGSQWGKLDGKYIRDPFKFELEGTFREPGPITKLMGNILSRWKIVKVSSPKTWGRNLITNGIMFNLSGTPMYEIPYYLWKAANQMVRKGVNYRALKSLGGIEKTLAQNELTSFMDVVQKPTTKQNIFSILDKVMMFRGLSKAYGGQENIFKLAKFIEVLESPKRYAREFKTFQAEKRGGWNEFANTEAQKWFFDYSTTSRLTKSLKNTLIPFITWQMKVAPRLAESAIKRPITFWKYPAMATMAFMKAKQVMNLSEQEWEQVKKMYPSYLRRGQVLVLPWKDKNNNLRMADLTFIMPGGFWLELFGGTYGAIKEGKSFEALTQWVKTVGNPILSAFVAMSTGKDPYTGRSLWEDASMTADKWINFLNYMVQLSFFSWMPGGYDFNKAMGLARGAKDWATGETKDILWEGLGFFGLATTDMNVSKFYTQAVVRLSGEIEEAKKRIRVNARALQNNQITEKKYNQRVAYYQKEIQRIAKEVDAINTARDIAQKKGLWNEPTK